MRRRLAALALSAATLVALSACADKAKDPKPSTGTSKNATATPSPASTATPAAVPPSVVPGVPGGADLKTVCAGYRKVEGEAGAKFLTLVQKLPEAIADPAKAGPAITELKAALKAYQAGLAAEAARSADGQLRAAIEADVATIAKATADIEAAGNDVTKALAALNTPEFQKLGERVKALCDK
jgi:hypothetical protein